MAKHKKTLEQKRKADERRQQAPHVHEQTGVSTTFSLPTYQFQPPQPRVASIPQQHAQTITLAHGLEKTIVVSSIIVAIELAIFFLLTHHILILPSTMLRY